MTLNGFLRSLRGELIRQLGGPRLHIWLAYRSHANRQGLAWPSRRLLTEETGYHSWVIKRQTQWLVKAKWLEWKGKFRSRVRVYLVRVPENVRGQITPPDVNSVGGQNAPPDPNVRGQNAPPDQGSNYTPLKSSIGSQPLKEEVLRPIAAIDRVWDFFLKATHRREGRALTLTPRRRKMAEARFKEILPRVADAGEAEKMMCRAIEGMTASKWHAGKNVDQTRYDSWERVFRSQDEFEVWLDQATSLTPYKESEPRILSGSYALTAPGRVTEDKKI